MSDPMPFSDEITEMYAELHAAEKALEAAEADLARLEHQLQQAEEATTAAYKDAEAAEAKLAAIEALHRRAIFVGLCDYCARGWPCETYRILHHNSTEDGAEP